MVHVVFSASEKGSLRVALSDPGGAAAVAVIGGTGGPPGRLSAKRWRRWQIWRIYSALPAGPPRSRTSQLRLQKRISADRRSSSRRGKASFRPRGVPTRRRRRSRA